MVETYLRLGVLDHRHLDGRAVDQAGDAGVVLRERRFVAKINLRGKPVKKFLDAARKPLGLSLPRKPNTTAAAKGLTALMLGPDEWLLIGAAGAEGKLAEALRKALKGQHAAITDVTEGRTVIGLSGVNARDLLTKGCPLDLHPSQFKPGDCAQSALAKATIILHQTGETDYDIYIERSMADYLWTWLEDAALEYGLAVAVG